MKRFLAHLWPFTAGAAAASGIIATMSAMTGNLGLAIVVALAASALLGYVALQADNERMAKLKEILTEESLAGGLHRPEQIPSTLDDLHEIVIGPEHASARPN